MHSEIEKSRELDSWIRAAHAELGTLQILLINAHERELNPSELGLHIANLGRQISKWKHERLLLSSHSSECAQPAAIFPTPLAAHTQRAAPSTRVKRAASIA